MKEGEAVELVCKAVGRPIPRITWYHDRQMVSPDNQIMIQDVDETTDCQSSTLSITDLLPAKHEGKYTIEAVNEVGSVKHTMRLSGANSMMFSIVTKLIESSLV